MADFTEEYLRRLTDVENQKVAQLSGIKDALEDSGIGGGTGCNCLTWAIEIQDDVDGQGETVTDYITTMTARELLTALEEGKRVTVIARQTYTDEYINQNGIWARDSKNVVSSSAIKFWGQPTNGYRAAISFPDDVDILLVAANLTDVLEVQLNTNDDNPPVS